MKRMYVKMFLLGTMVLGSFSMAQAQEGNGIFNHVSAAVSLGTTGIGIEVAAPITNYVAIRAGLDIMPQFKYSSDVSLGSVSGLPTGVSLPSEVAVEGKLKLTNGKFLIDAYPFQTSSFHLTVGAYFGNKDVINVYNKENGVLQQVANYNAQPGVNPVGAKIGDYLLTPDQNGNVKGEVKTNGFRPYVGFGFGRAIPQKHRFACGVDCGVMFWGTPEFYHGDVKLSKENLDGGGGFVKTMSKLSVYPCVSFKVAGRII
ncbi:MAG: hypothetical protein Q4F34_01155 [Prevotellaceae bacterium]|nr:hypothetical protein [Prevotellaceae bacterium]